MSKIIPGRVTHRYDGELVVFHIGMTINRWWRPDLWVPVFRAMTPMLTELFKDPDSGFMNFTFLWGSGGPHLVQYWSSLDKLYAYASDRDAAHRPAWTAFNKRARRAPGAVGIWHETYVVARAETIYVGTKPMGLPKATELVPITPKGDRAKGRMEEGRMAG